ncbi:peroxisome biogenesis factor 2-like isoform X3 [Rhopilema esculentum]|uniref:peroxisome biogenesis factor 2-like isoform X3 n=1 Tax=Rhopilema esculentum TaxID=499914 RepID=UPI0031D06EC1
MSWSEDDRSSKLTVLRIVQLDAAVLDQEILHLLESQLKAVFKYLQAETFRWQPEINLVLRAIIWKFTLGKNTATLGQSLFDVRYAANAGDGGLSHINLKARTVLALIYVASPWLQERLYDILSLIGDQQSISDKISIAGGASAWFATRIQQAPVDTKGKLHIHEQRNFMAWLCRIYLLCTPTHKNVWIKKPGP